MAHNSITGERAEKALESRISLLRDETRTLLAEFTPNQILNLILLVDESIENFAEESEQELALGICTGLDLLRRFYEEVPEYVWSDIDSWDIPEAIDVLQLFAVYAVSCYSRAEEILASLRGKRSNENSDSLIRAYDSCLEASQAMLFGFTEFKRTHKHPTDLESLKRKALGISTRTSGGGKGRSKKYDPLRTEAWRLYKELLENRQKRKRSEISEWEAAGKIIFELEEFATESGWYGDDEKKRNFPTRETVRNWLKRYRQRE